MGKYFEYLMAANKIKSFKFEPNGHSKAAETRMSDFIFLSF